MMKKLIATFGGLGLLPGMPGTYASLASTIIYYALWRELGEATRPVIAVLTVAVAGLALVAWKWSYELFQSKDARQFVLDEVVGQWLTLLCVPLTGPVLAYMAVGFFLFRAFDVAKPWPIKQIEWLPGKWGTLADDVAAAAYSAIGFWMLLFLTRALTNGTAA